MAIERLTQHGRDSNTPKLRVAIYTRVSTREQTLGYSLQIQKGACKTFAQSRGWLYRLYEDSGFSASDLNRPGIHRLLGDASQGKFVVLLCHRLDRISRNIVDFAPLYQDLRELGIDVVSTTQNIDTTSPLGRHFLHQLILYAQLERDLLLERSRAGMEARWNEGKWKGGVPPYGYDYDKNTGFLTVNKNEARIVNEIFDNYLKLQSIHQVAERLNDINVPTRHGGTWRDSALGRVLKRRTYKGILVQGKSTVNRPELKIISTKLWEKVAEKRQEQRPKIVRTSQDTHMSLEMDCHNCGHSVMTTMPFCPMCGIGLDLTYLAQNNMSDSKAKR